MIKITSGTVQRPQKVVIYGPEGIGKTTIASKFPDPLFIDTEGGTSHLDVKRVQKPEKWLDLNGIAGEIAADHPELCKTLVVDTADWAEQLAIEYLCEHYKKPSIEEFGYGKGYTYLAEEFTKFLYTLNGLIDAGINVVVTAHAKMRKFEQPDEMGAYDRWELKLSKTTAPLLKEWADMVLFCNYQTFVVKTDTGSAKAQGGKRVMYATHNPCWDAKNRHGLPDVMDMDYAKIAHLFPTEPNEHVDPLMKLVERIKASGIECTITGEEIKAKDMEGNEHSFFPNTGKIILINPDNPEQKFAKDGIPAEAFIKAMKTPNVTKLYFNN